MIDLRLFTIPVRNADKHAFSWVNEQGDKERDSERLLQGKEIKATDLIII